MVTPLLDKITLQCHRWTRARPMRWVSQTHLGSNLSHTIPLSQSGTATLNRVKIYRHTKWERISSVLDNFLSLICRQSCVIFR